MGDPWGVPTETRERILVEPWKTRVQVLFRQKGGAPDDHIGGYLGGQESGSEGGGVDVVESGFDV